MKILGNFLILFGLFVIWRGSVGARPFTWGGFFLLTICGLPLLWAGSWLQNLSHLDTQKSLDRRADRIARRGPVKPEPFFLYLRPFDTTNSFVINQGHLNFFSFERWERDGFDDLERVLSRTLKPTAPLIGLGHPGEHRGAGRVEVTEVEWKDKVADLARAAEFIFAIPSYHEGTLWQLSFISQEKLIEKCIFIMPPNGGPGFVTKLDAAERWKQAEAACSKLGLPLPQHHQGGGFFKYSKEAELCWFENLPIPNPVKWRRALQRGIDA